MKTTMTDGCHVIAIEGEKITQRRTLRSVSQSTLAEKYTYGDVVAVYEDALGCDDAAVLVGMIDNVRPGTTWGNVCVMILAYLTERGWKNA